MIKVVTGVEIDRSSDEVFAFISNFENNPKWQSGQLEARFSSEGPLRVGQPTTKWLSSWVVGSNLHLRS